MSSIIVNNLTNLQGTIYYSTMAVLNNIEKTERKRELTEKIHKLFDSLKEQKDKNDKDCIIEIQQKLKYQ